MKTLACCALLSVPWASAQPFRKHYVSLGAGGGQPRSEAGRYLDASPVFRAAYGYRFHRNFQADFGFETVFHAANVRDFLSTSFGDLRIKDYQFLLPMGGRAVIPFKRERIQLYAGGGAAYFRYQERIRQPFSSSDFRVQCPTCRSRDGFGGYGLLGASFALDRYQMFRLGVSTRVFRGRTNGDALGPLPPFRTSDHWVNSTVDFTISF